MLSKFPINEKARELACNARTNPMQYIRIYNYFYPALFGLIVIQIYLIPEIRLGVLTSAIIIITGIKHINKNMLMRKNTHNKLMLMFIAYNTSSIILYLENGIPVSAYVAEWSNSILPMLFYYIGYEDKEREAQFYKNTLNVLILSFILGFYLWTSDSELYRVFMNTTEGAGTDLLYFQSVYGLTATGAFGVIGFIIGASMIFDSNGAKMKIATLLCGLAAILTFRRAAMLTLLINFLILHYIGYIKFKFLKIKFLIIELLIAFTFIIYSNDFLIDIYQNIIERGSMIADAFDSRSNTWNIAFDYTYFITGRGLGAVGHKAVGSTDMLIPDGNYFKLLAENGIIIFLIFLYIILTPIIKGFKNTKNNYMEMIIIGTLCVMAIGSNIFTYQSLTPILWYAVGRLCARTST